MKILFHIFLLFIPITITAQPLSVSLFNSTPVKGLVVALYEGNYDIYTENDKVTDFGEQRIFYITLYNKKLILNNADGPFGCFDELYLGSQTNDGKLQITVIDPKVSVRTITGNIRLKIEYGRILLINEIDSEKYISGVVEAETGVNALPEFYKAQSLLCRTYMYSHIARHESEGFNLCDEVHCQSYKGHTPFTNYIYQSTSLTKNEVIVNKDNNLILAAFHANCGGETESSINTWLRSENYLVPVKDSYCANTSNSAWEKKITLADWKKYLAEQGIKTKSLPISSLEMKKAGRQNYYRVGKDSILTRQIRADWNLKSSFFQILIKKNEVIIKGKGYGHGVGLCQVGAMNMAVQGFSSENIVNFYFKNVRIKKINSN